MKALMSLREIARQLFLSTLGSVHVAKVMRREIHHDGEVLHVAGAEFRLRDFRRVKVVSVGKAATPMAETLVKLIRPHLHLDQKLDGIAVGTRMAEDPAIRSFLGGHPTPNDQSWAAGKAVLHYLGEEVDAGETLIFFLISGGASAMLEWPLDPGMTSADAIGFHQALVHSGLKIETMNVLRKHFSAVKGGRLAVAAAAAAKCTLLISDVPGDALHIVGSGPTLPDPSTVAECRAILEEHEGTLQLSEKMRIFFNSDSLPETPKPGDAAFIRSSNFALLSSNDLCREAAHLAQQQGFHVVVDNACDEWPCDAAADYLLHRINELAFEHSKICLLSAGEISVQVAGAHGFGGRNQHFVLECARRIAERDVRMTVLSGGSDGIDGNSDAAGGVADETTVARAASLQMSVSDALAAFDSNTVLAALGDTLLTGPSGNNVRDLRMLLMDQTAQASCIQPPLCVL